MAASGIVALVQHRCGGCGHTAKLPAGALGGMLPIGFTPSNVRRCADCEELVVPTEGSSCPLCKGSNLEDATTSGRLRRLACPRCGEPLRRDTFAR